MGRGSRQSSVGRNRLKGFRIYRIPRISLVSVQARVFRCCEKFHRYVGLWTRASMCARGRKPGAETGGEKGREREKEGWDVFRRLSIIGNL